ncbi:glycosyltransferase family 2 protein [Flavobacterium sp. WC2429]|uniref:Glycosyltransferase family 2 protein n=1 Tax=Flavobacterium sp. WC2429 TaxID=3234140 RepID=A0AB39WMK5_9FLAO
MKVFTIIVTYNGIHWIDKCLNSIVSQSEVLVVDNNSSDDTVTYIKTNFPSVKILPQTINYGFGIANNIGINYALQNEADAVFLLNQDAFAQTDCVKKLVIAYQQNSHYGIISPIHLNGKGSGVDHSFLKIISPFNASSLVSDLILGRYSKSIYEIYFINAAAWFIPKTVFYSVGGFDPLFFLYGEDDNYCQRVLFHGFKIGIIPDAMIYHDSNNSNYQIGEAGTEKYFRQFVNSVLVKYGDVNKNNYKKLKKFKMYIFKNIIINLTFFKIGKAILLFEKYKRVDISGIKKSVMKNKIKGSNYLEI